LNAKELFRFHTRVPVSIVERIPDGRRFGVMKKYRQTLLFIGKVPVLSILMLGLWGYLIYFGGIRYSIIQNELRTLLAHARIDNMTYQVVDFFEKKGQLIIYVMARK